MHFFAFASILLCNICKCTYSLMHLSTYAHIHLCTYSQIHNFRKCTYCICLCIYLYSHFHLFASALNERISDQVMIWITLLLTHVFAESPYWLLIPLSLAYTGLLIQLLTCSLLNHAEIFKSNLIHTLSKIFSEFFYHKI